MSDEDAPAPTVPRRLLAAAAVAVAIPVLTVGGLLLGLAEGTGPKTAGLALVLAALLTVGAGLAALRQRAEPRGPLRAAVGALLLAGVVGVALVAQESRFLLDLLIVGGVPTGGALVLGLLTRLAGPPRPV